jgi:DNA-binding CsgD family transcriptional regulator
MKPQSGNLSKREKDVVELLLQGKSNKQIALALGIAESTVEFHLKNIYTKLQVSSRTGAILKLGKSGGQLPPNLGETIVEKENRIKHTGGTFSRWKKPALLNQKVVSIPTKEIEMKNRLLRYFFSGLVFGGLFLFYFEVIDRFMNTLNIDPENPFQVWAFISMEFFLVFGIWAIPTIYPARYEFRHSRKVSLSAMAVTMTWVSAVFGYHLIYSVLLGFVGMPHVSVGLIVSKFVQWSVVSVIVGGSAGLIASLLYSFWIKKTNTILPE